MPPQALSRNGYVNRSPPVKESPPPLHGSGRRLSMPTYTPTASRWRWFCAWRFGAGTCANTRAACVAARPWALQRWMIWVAT
nr:unnamed protein product [Digitaria exilis]